MSSLSPDLRRRIVRRHHTTTRDELLAAGVAARDLSQWVATRVLTEITPGVYAVSDALAVEPFLTRAAALCASDDRVCDAVTSARIWGLPGIFRPARPTTSCAHRYPRGQLVTRADGLRLLSLEATWLELAEVLRPAQFLEWSMTVLDHDISLTGAHRAVRQLADPARAPHRRAAAAVSQRRSWQRPPGVELDRRVRASMRRRGITGLDGAAAIELDDAFVVHPTVVDHQLRWGVEVDHHRWHRGRHSQAMRRWIDRQLTRRGWTITVVRDATLTADFTAAMNDLVATRHEVVSRAA